jgi:hypothetical protein
MVSSSYSVAYVDANIDSHFAKALDLKCTTISSDVFNKD